MEGPSLPISLVNSANSFNKKFIQTLKIKSYWPSFIQQLFSERLLGAVLGAKKTEKTPVIMVLIIHKLANK